ncbi:MAG: hypothetical protein ABI192_00865 [Bradyrhizobium sp.]
MNWAWATSLDQVWRSPAFPTWLTIAAAGFFGIILLITLLRAERSVANGALAVITLLAIGIAAIASYRGFGPADAAGSAAAPQSPPQLSAALPALSCIDDIAGETVLTACEKGLFGSAESAAAAVSYAASRVTRLTALGDVAAANRNMTPELQALRRSVERDRYGLVAHVLLTRDHCTPADCAAFRSLTDHNQIVANMDERIYNGFVTRYAPSWNAPPAGPATAAGLVAALPGSMPTGRPTNADFPSAASTPPVSIMNPEPGTSASRAPAVSNAPSASTRPAAAPHSAAPALAAAAKKPPAKPHPAAPVQIAPAASAPAASND